MTAVMAGIAATATSAPRKRHYSVTEAFFKEAINKAVVDSVLSPVKLGEKHDVRLKPNFDTACWAFLPPHRIYIGTDIMEKDFVKKNLSTELQQRYIANHYHHEMGHALFTLRDMTRIGKALKAIECPFPLYNLFEDAYIEHRYRTEAGYRFEWLKCENMDFQPRPESLFFALVQSEGDEQLVRDSLDAWEPKLSELKMGDAASVDEVRAALKGQLDRVIEYYRKATAVRDSLSLMPLLRKWLEEFGKPPQQESPGESTPSDLELSHELMTNEEGLKQFEVGTIVVMGEDGHPDKSQPGKARPEDIDAIASNGEVLHDESTPVDLERAERLAQRFMKFFAAKTRMVGTSSPQRRFSTRHFVIDRKPYRRKETEGRGAKEVFVEVDCSGSMCGFHIMEGKVLITALSILARKGYVTGHVALSAVKNKRPTYQVFRLPMAQENIDRIQGYAGAEGLAYTLQSNLKLAQSADYVFVYTDAQICDRPIDKEYFHQMGIHTWGLYAGLNDYLEQMLKYFDKAIMRASAEELVDAMLVQNK